MKTKPFMSAVQTTEDGFLVLPEHGEEPPLLESVEALWLKLHPHLTHIHFDSRKPADAPPLEELQFTSNLFNMIGPIFEDIDKMKDNQRFLDTESKNFRRISRNSSKLTESQKKINSLERQQEAFQARKNTANADFGSEEASLTVCKTLNSIRLLFPLFVRMTQHESRNDTELVIEDRKLRQDNRKSQNWLLGDFVYDIGSPKNLNTLTCRMNVMLGAFISNSIVDKVVTGKVPWNTLLPILLESQRVPSTLPNPMDWLTNASDKRDVMENASRHDEVFIADLLREKTSKDQNSQFLKAVTNLQRRIIDILSSRFHGARLDIYGSCMSDLSLGKTSDVDLSLHLPHLAEMRNAFRNGKESASKYETEKKRAVFAVVRKLGTDFRSEFRDTLGITRARVPVVKGRWLKAHNPYTDDGSIKFDVCFFNDIAVVNSRLLRDYTLVDIKAKYCMLAIKAWTCDFKINSAADDCISSYAWMNLVIFYLQCIGYLPNLQCPKLMEKVGFVPNPEENPLHFVDALNTAFVPWDTVQAHNAWEMPAELKEIPLSVFIHGFFHFYSYYFPKVLYSASIRTGKISVPKSARQKASLSFFCIEDPFETFSSHCPHDLGAPASESGQEHICRLIAENSTFLRGVLLGKSDSLTGELWKCPRRKGPRTLDGETKVNIHEMKIDLPRSNIGTTGRNKGRRNHQKNVTLQTQTENPTTADSERGEPEYPKKDLDTAKAVPMNLVTLDVARLDLMDPISRDASSPGIIQQSYLQTGVEAINRDNPKRRNRYPFKKDGKHGIEKTDGKGQKSPSHKAVPGTQRPPRVRRPRKGPPSAGNELPGTTLASSNSES